MYVRVYAWVGVFGLEFHDRSRHVRSEEQDDGNKHDSVGCVWVCEPVRGAEAARRELGEQIDCCQGKV